MCLLMLKSDFFRWSKAGFLFGSSNCQFLDYLKSWMERRTEVGDDTTTGMGKSAWGGMPNVMGLEKWLFLSGNNWYHNLLKVHFFSVSFVLKDVGQWIWEYLNCFKNLSPCVVAHKKLGNESFHLSSWSLKKKKERKLHLPKRQLFFAAREFY